MYSVHRTYPPIHRKKNPRQDLIRGETLMKKKNRKHICIFYVREKMVPTLSLSRVCRKKISFLITLIDFFFGTAIRTRLIRYTVHKKRRFFFFTLPLKATPKVTNTIVSPRFPVPQQYSTYSPSSLAFEKVE